MTAPPTSDVRPPPSPLAGGDGVAASLSTRGTGAGRAGGAGRGGRFHATVQSARRRPTAPVDGAGTPPIRATCRPTRQRPGPTGSTVGARGVTATSPLGATRTSPA